MMGSNESELDSLVKGEISAVETYKQAIEKIEDLETSEELKKIEADHEESLEMLRDCMAGRAQAPAGDSGLWGAWANAVEGTAKQFGRAAAIKALKEGEEHGVHEYEEAVESDDVSRDVKQLITMELLPKTRAHIPVLDRLLAAGERG